MRFAAANRHPDHDTIATFRRDNRGAIAESFLQVLLLAKKLKLMTLGMVSVDGTKFEPAASKRRSVRYDRAGELIDQLRLEIADLMERAEAADAGAAEDAREQVLAPVSLLGSEIKDERYPCGPDVFVLT